MEVKKTQNSKLIMYPAHFYEPLRRKIAEQYIQHEFKKMLPSLKAVAEWQKINSDIEQWFSGNLLMTPARQFWNGFHSIARGFRYKNLLPWLTSKNIQWQEKIVKITDLHFGATFEGVEFIGRNPSVVDVKTILSKPEHKQDKEKLLAILQSKADYTYPREQDPVIVNRVGGMLKVVDGNRRMFQALWSDKEEIQAYVGEPAGLPEIFEHWVPAAFLQDLLALHSRNQSSTKDFTLSTAKIIAETLKNSTAGKIEWDEMCLMATEPLDKLMYNEVLKLLT